MKNIVVFSPVLPLHDRDSGSFRLFQLLKLWREAGHAVTFVARGEADGLNPGPYLRNLLEIGVKVHPVDPDKLYDATGIRVDAPRVDLEELLLDDEPFDLAYHYHYFIAEQYMEAVRRISPWTRQVVDSVDIHFLREAREAELKNDPALKKRAEDTRARELAVYRRSDAVVVVTDADRAALLRATPGIPVRIVPNLHPVAGSIPGFDSRVGFLFVGGFGHTPNVDAVAWFHEAVWPTIQCALPGARAYIVGPNPPEEIRRMSNEQFVVTGYLPDLTPLLSACRVSIAPLRFGAGMKGKVGEAMASGIPVVGTSIALEGMGIGESIAPCTDSPASFAARAIELHKNREAWESASRAGSEFLRENYSIEALRGQVGKLAEEAACEYREPGLRLKKAKNYRAAAAAFRGAMRQNPSESLIDLADCLARTGRTDEAESLYRKASGDPALSANGFTGLGVLALVCGQSDRAEAFLDKAVAAGDGSGTARCGLGLIASGRGDSAGARHLFLEALSADPVNQVAILELTRIAYEGGDLESLEPVLRKYLEFDPVCPPILFTLAGLLHKMGKRQAAAETLETLRFAAPGYEGLAELEKSFSAHSRQQEGTARPATKGKDFGQTVQ